MSKGAISCCKVTPAVSSPTGPGEDRSLSVSTKDCDKVSSMEGMSGPGDTGEGWSVLVTTVTVLETT